ncbi:MAG TPA: trypsin-like peptidase domain-containing protein [Dehalococcoidia bacterium]|nr:trypsin-like peptidase domain-containing protein [Dehalococcoidia bacterium]
MSRKHIVIVVTLSALTLTVGIWALSTRLVSSPSNSHQSNSTAQYTAPNWTFPLEGESTIPLPDFRPVVSKVMPSVVSVTAELVTSDFFGRQYTESVAGSGILIDDKGYAATNNHVVEGAHSIYVELTDGRTFPANIVGTDALSDLAVIRVDATDLPYAHWGDSNSLSVGEWVLAIGNALGEGITATQGIVSRLDVSVNVAGNTLYGLVQTTAAINPGNSGGPLVNMSGEVIGITSVKIVASAVEGIGYAISSNEAKPIIEDLIRYGHVTYPWLGVSVSTVTPLLAASENLSVDRGALIAEIVAHSPAEAAGLQVGDIITRFGDKETPNLADLVQAIRASQIGQNVEIAFVRGKDTKTASAQLIESPAS